MSIIPKLATSLNRRDEVANQELAEEVLKHRDTAAVAELVENLANKNKGVRNDCIKVLYEIGYAEPGLIAGHWQAFLPLLTSKDNRLQWGAMYALGCIAKVRPDDLFSNISKIIDAADKGSVITRDGCVRILITLSSSDTYGEVAVSHLLGQIASCPTNQLPMYAEEAMRIINAGNRERFVKVLSARLGEIEKDSKRKRVEKVIKRISR